MSFLVSPSKTRAAKFMLTNPFFFSLKFYHLLKSVVYQNFNFSQVTSDVKKSIRNFCDMIPSDFSSRDT